jgi:hypothetical protein
MHTLSTTPGRELTYYEIRLKMFIYQLHRLALVTVKLQCQGRYNPDKGLRIFLLMQRTDQQMRALFIRRQAPVPKFARGGISGLAEVPAVKGPEIIGDWQQRAWEKIAAALEKHTRERRRIEQEFKRRTTNQHQGELASWIRTRQAWNIFP